MVCFYFSLVSKVWRARQWQPAAIFQYSRHLHLRVHFLAPSPWQLSVVSCQLFISSLVISRFCVISRQLSAVISQYELGGPQKPSGRPGRWSHRIVQAAAGRCCWWVTVPTSCQCRVVHLRMGRRVQVWWQRWLGFSLFFWHLHHIHNCWPGITLLESHSQSPAGIPGGRERASLHASGVEAHLPGGNSPATWCQRHVAQWPGRSRSRCQSTLVRQLLMVIWNVQLAVVSCQICLVILQLGDCQICQLSVGRWWLFFPILDVLVGSFSMLGLLFFMLRLIYSPAQDRTMRTWPWQKRA